MKDNETPLTYTIETPARAIASIRGFGTSSFREDAIEVPCASQSEKGKVVSEAKEALRRGYVKRVVYDKNGSDLTVFIIFCRPVITTADGTFKPVA